jgi:hypothetical protein
MAVAMAAIRPGSDSKYSVEDDDLLPLLAFGAPLGLPLELPLVLSCFDYWPPLFQDKWNWRIMDLSAFKAHSI